MKRRLEKEKIKRNHGNIDSTKAVLGMREIKPQSDLIWAPHSISCHGSFGRSNLEVICFCPTLRVKLYCYLYLRLDWFDFCACCEDAQALRHQSQWSIQLLGIFTRQHANSIAVRQLLRWWGTSISWLDFWWRAYELLWLGDINRFCMMCKLCMIEVVNKLLILKPSAHWFISLHFAVHKPQIISVWYFKWLIASLEVSLSLLSNVKLVSFHNGFSLKKSDVIHKLVSAYFSHDRIFVTGRWTADRHHWFLLDAYLPKTNIWSLNK